MKQFLTEAFKQMELIESNEFTYDADGAKELANFMEGDMLDDFEAIIDPEAETKEDLKDSYIGDVICECQICKSKIFKSADEIKIDSEDAELANVGEACPYCFETDGFKVIGQVAPFEEVTVETDGDTDVKVEVDGKAVETEDNELTARHAKDNEDLEDSQRYPIESPVGAKGLKESNKEETEQDKKLKLARKMRLARHKKDNEDLEDSQRYPIESPAPAQTGLAMMEGMSVRDKLEAAFPGVFNFSDRKEESLTEGVFKSSLIFTLELKAEDSLNNITDTLAKRLGGEVTSSSRSRARIDVVKKDVQSYKTTKQLEDYVNRVLSSTSLVINEYNRKAKQQNVDKIDGVDVDIKLSVDANLLKRGKASDAQQMKLYSCYLGTQTSSVMDRYGNRGTAYSSKPKVQDENSRIEQVSNTLKGIFESLTEGMEDISITTDDQIIKVKATPRTDKEAIQLVDDATKEIIETEETTEEIEETTEETEAEQIPVEEETTEETEEDIEITDFDEEAFDDLGESYLKRVYDNVSSFKTTDGSISGDKLILEGIITFNSGKSAKTKFIFESKTITKSGKVKLVGLNEHISSNKNSFTLTGTIENKKLLSESLNYNYGARSDEGKMKRLYGTVRRNIK